MIAVVMVNALKVHVFVRNIGMVLIALKRNALMIAMAMGFVILLL
jgi:hypothetical protein